jgi:hypothetical protein
VSPGACVRITSRCIGNGRTGIVTETPAVWADRGWHRVDLDPKPSFPTWGIFPPDELSPIKATVRTGQPAQASLFGGGL